MLPAADARSRCPYRPMPRILHRSRQRGDAAGARGAATRLTYLDTLPPLTLLVPPSYNRESGPTPNPLPEGKRGNRYAHGLPFPGGKEPGWLVR